MLPPIAAPMASPMMNAQNAYKPGMMPMAHPALGGVLSAIHNVAPHPMAPQMIGALNDFLHAHTAMGPRPGMQPAPQMNGRIGNPMPMAALLAGLPRGR